MHQKHRDKIGKMSYAVGTLNCEIMVMSPSTAMNRKYTTWHTGAKGKNKLQDTKRRIGTKWEM
jgi:hypothetical protein